jgi:hypothetical protein
MTGLPEGEWRRSTYCGANSCVEVALLDGRIAMRDSKHVDGPVLWFDPAEWLALLEGIRNGELRRDHDTA